VQVGEDELSLRTAVETYLFNSQIGTRPDEGMVLLCPTECEDNEAARAAVERIVADASNPIASVRYADVRQSMRNGGGPACLRLRITLTPLERAAAHPGVFWSDQLDRRLRRWIRQHYRDELHLADLADPQLLEESRTALDELTRILGLGSMYPFQRTAGEAERPASRAVAQAGESVS